jgi:hypothetical protein
MNDEFIAALRFEQVLRRRVQDAAFYWRQLGGSLQSSQLTPDRLETFSLQTDVELVVSWLAAQLDHPSRACPSQHRNASRGLMVKARNRSGCHGQQNSGYLADIP